ncbi:PQ-loop repeat-containing protein [Bradyrhizobium sp. CCGB12]|uniref:PQ-loop repeat-containing protein n=1 Tax=Bradyrhizobium sp. CCGB12 TaxID=2949632 RepID=UPI0020B3F17D|nr:PQ-loop repeat-containing protein [Bradyrhizobium sp. CCGB12]MCP3388885.1 PQ-loop repeat-containing protein [Bradyrhizobium sp. CCGB12]
MNTLHTWLSQQHSFLIGYFGTGLVIGAYVPQIWRLWSEQCSAGISARAYALWMLSSALFLGHSITIGDVVFAITQLVNMIALAIIVVLARRFRNQICTTHARQLHS